MPTIKQNKVLGVLDKIFKDPSVDYGLKEFEDIDFEKVLYVWEEEKRFYIKDIKSGNPRVVFDEQKQSSKPEEIIRQLWLHKLHINLKYSFDRMETEKSIHFGREIHAKAADIVVYKEDKVTPYIILELKSPSEEKGIDQLKSYLNAEGCEIGIWSNGIDRVILYRNYPNQFEDTLSEIPPANKTIDDILSEKKTLGDTDSKYDLKSAIKIMEELVLANAGVDVFTEVFKLIYAKLYDEIEAEKRLDNEILFRKYKDPQKTYSAINSLFRSAIGKWPDIFYEQEVIRLSPEHLSVVIGEMEKAKLFGADLSIIDEAFECLIPEVAKGKKGQYFTPRHVVAMAVKMLNPKPDEYVIDPAAGSGGFLISAMRWVDEQYLKDNRSKQEYAQQYLYGIDFADETAKVSRALMLIAGDGRSHLFKLNDELYRQLKKNFEPQIGEMLLTKDATPGIAYVAKESVEGIISGGILRLRVKADIDQEYLALCINSIIGKMQAERDAGGSVIAHWKPEQIRNLLIPVLRESTQQKIAELVRKAHEARKKSKELLEEAKRKVEEMIEEGVVK